MIRIQLVVLMLAAGAAGICAAQSTRPAPSPYASPSDRPALTDEQLNDLHRQARHADLRQAIVDQADRIDRLANNINSLIVQHQNAARSAVAYGNLVNYLQQVQANPGLDWLQRQTTSTSTADAAGQGLDAWM